MEKEAKYFAIAAHEACGQKRKYSGEPYYKHPERVAERVREFGGSDAMIAAAWLHDTIEDTGVTYEVIKLLFGLEIAELVRELTKVSRAEDGNRETRKAIDRAFLANVSAEAQTIKCADIIDNIQDIAEADPGFAIKYLAEKKAVLDVMTLADSAIRAYAYEVYERLSK